jgi:thiamine-phosphate pyrophosphorylase
MTVQLRLKRTGDRAALDLLRFLKPYVPRLIVNDRVDLALLTGTGVHVGSDDLPVPEARKLLGPEAVIGATCRSLEEVERAHREGASYAGVGPVFDSRTKKLEVPNLGLSGLGKIAQASPLPVVAISGIDESNIGAVAKCGVQGAAVSHAVFFGEIRDIEPRVVMMVKAFHR